MAEVQHKNIQDGNIHPIANWTFSSNSERENASVLEEDVGKVAFQSNNNTLWYLLSSAPTWKRILTQGDATTPAGAAGGHLQGVYPNPIVKADSHTHTQATLPAYPTTLPPNGNAGGDLTGEYPNPVLRNQTGLAAGQYVKPIVTVNEKGLITDIETDTSDGDALAAVTTPNYDNVSDTIATTKFVTNGDLYNSKLETGEELNIRTGFVKEVHKVYVVNGTLKVSGNLYVTDSGVVDLKPMSSASEFIPSNFYKLWLSGHSITGDSKLILEGIIKVI